MVSRRAPIDRRRFFTLGAAASGLAVGASPSDEPRAEARTSSGMRYRPLGRTGLRVSEIAFGAHQVHNPPLMQAALDAGINTFCTSDSYLDGREEESIGQVIRAIGPGRRDDLVLVTGDQIRPGTTRQRVQSLIETSLRRLGTDHIDVYCASEACSPGDLRLDGLFEAFEEARRAGKVSHLAVSGHCGGMQEVLNAAIDDGRFRMLFTKYDFVSYPEVGQILHRAAERGIGTMVFKVDAGGRQKEIRDLERGGMSFRQATLKWALSNPDVASVAVTITSFEQIREATGAVGSSLTEAESEMLRRYAREMHDRYCRFCRTCERRCPRGAAVAEVMRYAMYFSSYGREKEAMRLYAALSAGRSAAGCNGCAGPCEGACPFGRAIRSEMVSAHRRLSFVSA
jgi:aryl-alcohol dehydrogenase-like predicted oxidoreductase